jgi:hypothetical protein
VDREELMGRYRTFHFSTFNYQLITIMEDAKETLKKLTAWDTTPELTDGEIDKLLENASLTDVDENHPSSPGWTPTYDLNAAASAGWLIKAGRASSLVELGSPGSGDFTAKVFQNCLEMARLYRSKISGTVSIAIKGE